MKFTVALDGPAASGKGTISRAIAREFGFAHLDTGLLYRAVGALTRDGRDPIDAARNLTAEDLSRDDLRGEGAGEAASKVAAIPEVRNALLEFQQAFSRREGGAVLDGRDIGTVVCPQAEVKLFVTASEQVRAYRRWQEEGGAQANRTEAEVLADLKARDARDRGRDDAPMRAAEDALVLDTTSLSIDAAVSQAVALIRDRLG